MKSIALIFGSFMLGSLWLVPIRADMSGSFEKALYDKARFQVLTKASDDDFVCYCATMNLGGETLLRLHDEILVKQAELATLQSQGLTNDHPQVMAVNADLKDLRAKLAVKVVEARKGLEIESKIAEATLTALSDYQK
jgi:hypothetical protein